MKYSLELKKKGKNLRKDDCALIDTSNRTRDLKKLSVLALASDKIKFTASMTSSEKIKIFGKLNQKYNEENCYALMHSVKLFYALIENIELVPSVYICGDGLNPSLTKHYLKKLLGTKYHDKKIVILPSLAPMFGKRNIAHELANEVRKKKAKNSTIKIGLSNFRKLNLIK